jgi:hypothetical protein
MANNGQKCLRSVVLQSEALGMALCLLASLLYQLTTEDPVKSLGTMGSPY